MKNFIYDLWRVQNDHVGRPAVIVGHSLGGQIASRYAAVFPETIVGLVLVEGLGPPAFPEPADEHAWLKGYRERLLTRFADSAPGRGLGNVEFATSRLLANNPRLDAARAPQIAAALTRRDDQDKLVWAFDSHAGAAFVRADRDEGE